MNVQQQIDLLVQLGKFMQGSDASWAAARAKAERENGWFTQEFISLACDHIATAFLSRPALEAWIGRYQLPHLAPNPRTVGIVMAGNIPLVGFHDWLCAFVAGHHTRIKCSSKDAVLLPFLLEYLFELAPELEGKHAVDTMLKNCDAYIATGSNNSARHFEYYFAKYPHIIRRNRTSAAILSGNETPAQLEALADDMHQYFGLGCRNITKLYVPHGYDFIPLLAAGKKYNYFKDHNKYRNNYDYNLALYILNNQYYMTNESLLLVESSELFSPISQVNYEFYEDVTTAGQQLQGSDDVQCIVGKEGMPFGQSQLPALSDYADGVDTMEFMLSLH
jgi:hypothetical protein